MKSDEALRLRDTCDNLYEIAPDVVALLKKHRQTLLREHERGGQLFLRNRSLTTISIDHATPPHPADRATRSSLILDHARCATEIRIANAKGLWLVGYWHTHPESQPRISSADINSMRQSLASDGYQLTAMLALVVGNSNLRKFLSAYLMRADEVEELSLLNT